MSLLSDLPPGVEPHMIPGNGQPDDVSVPVIVHCGDPPEERIECVVQLGVTSEWLVATWRPDVRRWKFPYEVPIADTTASAVVMWADLREIFCAGEWLIATWRPDVRRR